MKPEELKQATELAIKRSEYLTGLKKWCDGYLTNEELSIEKSVKVDTTTGNAVKALKARCTELILEDALTVLTYNLEGKKSWANKPQTP